MLEILMSKPFWLGLLQWGVIAALPSPRRLWSGQSLPVWLLMLVDALLLLSAMVLILLVPLWLLDLFPLREDAVRRAWVAGALFAGLLAPAIRSSLKRRD